MPHASKLGLAFTSCLPILAGVAACDRTATRSLEPDAVVDPARRPDFNPGGPRAPVQRPEHRPQHEVPVAGPAPRPEPDAPSPAGAAPEPATIALVGGGALLIAGAQRRRSQAAKSGTEPA